MTKLFKNLPNKTLMLNMKNLDIHHDIKFTDLRQATKLLEEIESIISSEQERQENYTKTKHHSVMLYITMGLAGFSVVLVLIIYIMVKCRHSRGRARYPPMYIDSYQMHPMYRHKPTAPRPLSR